ncbi:MAG TPA: penicillin-binding protein 2, partial [Firmicutes bacterium]|nr:penicillin-binding protein 2 [Bacillota bacterium]
GSYYKRLADTNCVSLVKDRAPRGHIYDRNYRRIVNNEPSYTVGIIPYHFAGNEEKEKAIEDIGKVLGMSAESIKSGISSSREYVLEPVVLKKDISMEELSKISEKAIEINGIYLSQEPKRAYPYSGLAAHMLGYVGEVTDGQLKRGKYNSYRPGDVVGQTGVENFYDEEIRGKDGVVYILTDARGRQKEILDKIEPVKGKDLVLTMDYRLQRYAERLMDEKGYHGVIIVSVPKTGEILCMVSKPDFDLNFFSGRINVTEWKKLTRNTARPLNNRAVQGLYSPGSIFKIADGLGGLAEGIVDVKDGFNCDGVYWIQTWPYKCWKHSGHGWVDFEKAIAESCDVYFYKLGMEMKVELLYKYAKMFGLGAKTGIDLPSEKSGLVPSREWKRRVTRTPWFPGNTVMMSIGQGYIVSTPLQMMNIVSAIANGGYAMEPRVLKAVTFDDRRIYRTYQAKKLFELNVEKKHIEIMQSAMRKAVGGRHGTGASAALKNIQVAGKTATVENQQGENHAMFAGYAPYEDPEVVIYVLVEHGGGGGVTAGPVARDILEYYFEYTRIKAQ